MTARKYLDAAKQIIQHPQDSLNALYNAKFYHDILRIY